MAEASFLTYKGKPIVRKGNVIYYGNTEEKYIIMLTVNSSHDVAGVDVAEKVTVELILSDKSVDPKKRSVKKTEKVGLYNAMDIGCIWLDRALKE